MVDWALSRERYWGTPLPVWLCDKGHMHVAGSRKELEEMSVTPLTEKDLPELHRSHIDRGGAARCPERGGHAPHQRGD